MILSTLLAYLAVGGLVLWMLIFIKTTHIQLFSKATGYK